MPSKCILTTPHWSLGEEGGVRMVGRRRELTLTLTLTQVGAREHSP